MSSTLRNKDRQVSVDYYATPIDEITNFLENTIEGIPSFPIGKVNDIFVLDPCAGGDETRPMSYPTAIEAFAKKNGKSCGINTLDIREDSPAKYHGSYLADNDMWKDKFDVIITNPPFSEALNIIKKALKDVKHGGYVVMLLRLNFFGSQIRKDFWLHNMAKYCFVHSKRMSFHGSKGTDSIEYMHCVWQKGYNPEYCLTKVI